MAYNMARSFLVTAILLLTGPAALAQTGYSPPGLGPMSQPATTQRVPWDRAAGFRTQCGQELQRFCNGVQPGEGRLIQCLASHRSQLSPACISRVVTGRPALGEIPISENTQSPGAPSGSRSPGHPVTESALRASCGPDAQKLCGGNSREIDGVIKCLSAHRMELSPTCDAFFNEMPARRAAQKGPPKSAPPAASRSTAPPAAAGDAAATDAPSAPHGATAPPGAANDAAATDALSAPHGPSAPSATTSDIANTGAPSTAHGSTTAPAAANGGADAGAPPASTDVPATNAPPPADSSHAKGALAFPL
jgi:hypothetical protein